MTITTNYLIRFCILFPLLTSVSGFSEDKNTSSIAGRITFTKGEVTCGKESEEKKVVPGMTVAVNEIVKTGHEAKVKIILTGEKKILVTILADTKVKINSQGVELLNGDKKNIILKKIGILDLSPELNERSRQLGGTFVMRGEKQILKTVNLTSTSIRERRPAFRWTSEKVGSFLISLYQMKENGEKIPLWVFQTSDDSLPFPGNQQDLEEGNYYYWEIADLQDKKDETKTSAGFYVLSAEEKKYFAKELNQLEESVKGDKEDLVTSAFLKIELLNKYNLKDELKNYLIELVSTQQENEYFKNMLKTF